MLYLAIAIFTAEDVVMQNIDGQVANSQGIQWIEDVDVDADTSSSAQSSLALYPHLRTHYEVSSVESETQSNIISIDDRPSTDPVTLTNDSRGLETDIRFLDLKLLKLAAATKRLDPLKLICQYEIPGGGTCRDGTCEDIHLSRLISSDDQNAMYENEPNDDDTAEYLFNKLPHLRDVKSAGRIKAALEEMRLQPLRMTLEDRVMRALAVLKPPPPPPPPQRHTAPE
ncbi:hypothetical protein M378DRAFT_726391 [Amanita muscaria Koide BX008]|uniref:Zinc-finger domain-containing protein n=1 Tax=Amanita muscaria (strain Koide BX008) TaxID=946122 RepID=A0A0C2X279_AMAMK|nr:hypothetical protein M378DRAFT_726391 [Amanita muscaria Koide BX008]